MEVVTPPLVAVAVVQRRGSEVASGGGLEKQCRVGELSLLHCLLCCLTSSIPPPAVCVGVGGLVEVCLGSSGVAASVAGKSLIGAIASCNPEKWIFSVNVWQYIYVYTYMTVHNSFSAAWALQLFHWSTQISNFRDATYLQTTLIQTLLPSNFQQHTYIYMW